MTPRELLDGELVYSQDEEFYRKISHARILITGICGSIGRQLLSDLVEHRLLENGRIHGIDLDERAVDEISHVSKYMTSTIDVGDFVDVPSFRHYTHVIHCAAFKHVHLGEYNKAAFRKNNVEKVATLIYRMRHEGEGLGPKLIFVSTDKAAGNTFMGKTKAEAEELVLRAGHVAIRLVNVVGSRGSCVDHWTHSKDPWVTRFQSKRFWMQPKDASYALVMACSLPRGLYTVHNVPEFTVQEVAQAFQEKTGRKIREGAGNRGDREFEFLYDSSDQFFPINEVVGRIVHLRYEPDELEAFYETEDTRTVKERQSEEKLRLISSLFKK